MNVRLLNWGRPALFTFIAGLTLHAIAAPLQLVSTIDSSHGPAAGGSGDSWTPILSPDGRYVLFASTANNLMLTSSNAPISARFPARFNVFLRDRINGTTTLVSVNLSGIAGGNGDSFPVDISTNGRYAAFESSASDLVAEDTNNATDVFVRDLVNGTTALVSASTAGGVGNGPSRSAAMTPDGRYVAFVSAANNLTAGDTNGIADVFVRDLQSGSTVLASVGAQYAGAPYYFQPSSSEAPAITPDGRYVAFYSAATNLVPGVTMMGDIYVRDMLAGSTYWASVDARTILQTVQGTASGVCYNHALSADGQHVAYEVSSKSGPTYGTAGIVLRYTLGSGITDLVNTNASVQMVPIEDIQSLDMTPDGQRIAFVANTNGTAGTTTCVYVWDAPSRTTMLASGDLSGQVPANSLCEWPSLDSSGRYVTFLSSANNMVTNTTLAGYHLYLRDLQAGVTTLLDGDTNGLGSVSSATVPRLSADGRFVAFECGDGSLVADDSNGRFDVFMRDLETGASEMVSARDPALPAVAADGATLCTAFSASTDARYIAFASEADNLVAGDTNGYRDVFVRDLAAGTNILVSLSLQGFGANGISTEPTLSGDGRYVGFTSSATNLVAGDTNNASDVFVRDLQAGTTALVSRRSGSTGSGNGASSLPILSENGRYVLFRSKASNLAAGTFTGENLFLRDLQAGTNYALTRNGVFYATMTPDGSYVALYGAVSSTTPYLYLWKTLSATWVYTNTVAGISAVGLSPDGQRLVYSTLSSLYLVDRLANTNGIFFAGRAAPRPGLRFSRDGRFLTYAAVVNNTNQVYLRDCQTGADNLVSRSCTSGGAAYGHSDSPDIGADGNFVAYRSVAGDLVAGDTNGLADIYLYERQSGATSLLTASRYGSRAADNRSLAPVFCGDGRTLMFQSRASDLVAGDFNYSEDVFAFAFLYASILPDPTPGQGVWVSWPVAPGSTYRVQFKNNLSDSLWQELAGSITNIGNKAYLNDPAPGLSRRFYRVLAY